MIDGPLDLVIVGAGLSAVSFLRAGGASEGRTLLIDYGDRAGGPLRFLLEPGLIEEAISRVPFMPRTTALRLKADETGDGYRLLVSGPSGEQLIQSRNVLLACGGFEVTREHEEIPGARPAGVGTPVFANQMLDRGILPGRRPVIFGAERYAMATAHRLASAGAHVRVVLPTGGIVSRADFEGIEILPSGHVIRVDGSPRLERITVRDRKGEHDIEADLLLYAIGIVPNTGWLREAGVHLAATGALVVDDRGMTNARGVYAIGTAVTPSIDHDASLVMGEHLAAVERTTEARR